MTSWFSFRNLLALAILVLAGTLAVIVVRNFQGSAPQEIVEALPKDVDLSLHKLNYTETQGGIRKWSLIADSAAFSAGAGFTQVENIHMTFFDRDGRETLTLTAREGEVETEAGRVAVQGGVVVKSMRGYTILADRLEYSKTDDLLHSEVPVRIVADWMELSGNSLRLRLQDQKLSLKGNVQTRIFGEEQRKSR